METHYKDVLDGKKETLTLYPDGFQFDKRVETYNTAVLCQLEKMKENLEKKQAEEFEATNDLIHILKQQQKDGKSCGQVIKNVLGSSTDLPQDVKNELNRFFQDHSFYHESDLKDMIKKTIVENQLKAMKKFIQKIKPQQAEAEIINQLSSLFFNQRGLLLHSLKMDTFLQIFTDEAKRYRKKHNPGFELTPLENQIANAINLTPMELEDAAKNITEQLIKYNDGKNKLTFSGKEIYSAINRCDFWHENLKTRAKRKFDGKMKYSLQDIKNAIKLSRFEHEAKHPGEVDVLGILPDIELIMQIEVKCDLKTNSAEKNNLNLKSAAKQLQKYSNHIARVHGPVLTENWKYLKVAAILPNVGNLERVCNHCRRFIITTDVMENKGLPIWWKEIGILDTKVETSNSKERFYEDFLNLFNRLVNLTAISRQKATFNAWKEVQGENRQNIIAGITPSLDQTDSSLRFQDVINRPMDISKLLYFNPEQMFLLSAKELNRVVLFADYGCGK